MKTTQLSLKEILRSPLKCINRWKAWQSTHKNSLFMPETDNEFKGSFIHTITKENKMLGNKFKEAESLLTENCSTLLEEI